MTTEELLNAYLALAPGDQKLFHRLLADHAGHKKSLKALAGSLMGRVSGGAKADASRENGKRGGRPPLKIKN